MSKENCEFRKFYDLFSAVSSAVGETADFKNPVYQSLYNILSEWVDAAFFSLPEKIEITLHDEI